MAFETTHVETRENGRSPVRIGYGYKRREATLLKAGAEAVWIDHTPDRAELAFLLDNPKQIAIRPGDVLVVVSQYDLGPARKDMARRLKRWGATMEIVDTKAKPVREGKAKGGRPRYYDPTPEQDAAIRALWNSPATRKYVRERATEIMGKPIAHHHLRDRYTEKKD